MDMRKSQSRRLARKWAALSIPVFAAICAASAARACPFCNAAMQTLSQEITSADVALIARLVEPMPAADDPAGGIGAAPTDSAAKFEVVEVIRGEEKLEGAKHINVVYFGQDPPDKSFLITGLAGVTGPGLDWTTPVPLSERAVDYVRKLLTAPPSGADRLAFFQEYLEDEDPLLAQDAYDEFAKTPYPDVVALGPRMNRERLLAWLQDPEVGPSGRRLYLTLLGICGQPEDVAMLEGLLNHDYQLMKPGIATVITMPSAGIAQYGSGLIDEVLHADERRKKESLDALIACYLKLKGPDGLEVVNERFLKNPDVEFKHLHSAIMALRFHGEETDVIPKDQLLDSMRLALDHKDFADQVIPDLTRWEDWEIMPRLVKMFKESPEDDWIRQPVVSYLLIAAEQEGDVGQQAQAALKDAEALDPQTVERARSLPVFSYLGRAAAQAPAPSSGPADAAGAEPPRVGVRPEQPADSAADSSGAASSKEAADSTKAGRDARANKAATAKSDLSSPSRVKIVGIPLLAAALLLAVFAVLLRGADPRSSNEGA